MFSAAKHASVEGVARRDCKSSAGKMPVIPELLVVIYAERLRAAVVAKQPIRKCS